MVFCAIVGCGNRTERDKGSYCRIPKVRKHEGPEERARSAERRQLWIKAISRADLSETKLNFERICWKHFVNGKAASPWDVNSIDWVPTLNLGHQKFDATAAAKRCCERFERLRLRKKRQLQMEEQYITDKQEASSLVPASPQNHHPRKLPNIPRNPEIYQPSPGIFKYIRKDSKITVPSSSSTSLKDSTRVSPVSSSTNLFDSLATSKPSTLSYTDTESEEMLMELECYDEAGHNESMFPQMEPVEPLPNLVGSPPRLNGNPCKPGTNPTSSGTHPPRTGASASGLGYKRPNLDYQPPKLGDHVLHISTQPNSTTLPLSSEATEIDQCTPTDCDKFDTLKAKLNRAMQLYTLQRRQIVKLSGRVKNLSRTNERLTERSRLANTGSQGVNRPSPCLATDTKYIILFENLINPEAMNTITSAMSTADKPSD